MFSWLSSVHRPLPQLSPSRSSSDAACSSSSSAPPETKKPRLKLKNLPLASRYCMMKDNPEKILFVHRSRIHGRGLFTRRAFEPGDLVVEYQGEYVRSVVADKRERLYERANLGCYMFRVDDTTVLDATKQGNCARFINHSCEPNCHSKVSNLFGRKRILIFALKDIGVGEELTYNYKFAVEEHDRLPCHCKSSKCRKYLN
jgi:SET domain-containing protein